MGFQRIGQDLTGEDLAAEHPPHLREVWVNTNENSQSYRFIFLKEGINEGQHFKKFISHDTIILSQCLQRKEGKITCAEECIWQFMMVPCLNVIFLAFLSVSF